MFNVCYSLIACLFTVAKFITNKEPAKVVDQLRLACCGLDIVTYVIVSKNISRPLSIDRPLSIISGTQNCSFNFSINSLTVFHNVIKIPNLLGL